MSRAFCLNSLLPRSISTTLFRSSSLSADMMPRGESPAARTSAQKVHLKSSPLKDRITGLLHESAHALRVDAHEAAAPFANFPGDKDGLHVAGVHEIDDRSRRIVERPDIESIGAQDDDVGVLARAQRAGLAVEVGTTSTLDGGELEHLPTRQQRRQVLLAVAPALQHEIALRDGGRSHEREEIRRERHGVIGAEAGDRKSVV